MKVVWEMGKCNIGVLRKQLPVASNGKPLAHSTVSTLLRILCDKKFLGYEVQGRSYLYYPLVSKEDYSKLSLRSLIQNYFDGSMSALVSFLIKEEDLDIDTLNELLENPNK